MPPIVPEEAFTIIKSTSLSVIVNTSLFYVRSGHVYKLNNIFTEIREDW
jgi:hypothetical protein